MSATKKLSKDHYLFRESDAPDAMYIIKSGQLAVTKTKGNSEVILAELKPGQMVGEMALFDRKPRSASVKATKESEVIMLPYDAMTSQLETLPVWVKAILRTLNDNLREANKKIKILETNTQDEDRYPPHVINRILSIINYIGLKYGQKEGEVISIPQNRLRNFTIQVFQEATNKMQSVLEALQEMGYVEITDLGEGKQKILNKNPNFLFEFVDWYNDWLFKPDKEKVNFSAEEIKLLEGLIHFAKKVQEGPNGVRKIDLNTVQNDSMRDLGFLIKMDDFGSLIEKKVVSEKVMDEKGVFITMMLPEIEPQMKFWKIIWEFRKKLR